MFIGHISIYLAKMLLRTDGERPHIFTVVLDFWFYWMLNIFSLCIYILFDNILDISPY